MYMHMFVYLHIGVYTSLYAYIHTYEEKCIRALVKDIRRASSVRVCTQDSVVGRGRSHRVGQVAPIRDVHCTTQVGFPLVTPPRSPRRPTQVRPTWIASWLHTKFPASFSAEVLRQVSSTHKDNLLHIFQLATGLYAKDQLFSECPSDPDLFSRYCSARADSMGFNADDFVEKCIDKESGAVKWDSYPYSSNWSDSGKVESIHSYLGDVAFLKEHQVITQQFSIAFASDLTRAVARFDETEHVLINFFGKDTRTRTHMQDKKGTNVLELLRQVKKEKEQTDKAAAQLRVGPSAEVLTAESTADKEARKRKADQARLAVVQAKAARVQTLDLASMPTSGA